jgi:hypothetical protein
MYCSHSGEEYVMEFGLFATGSKPSFLRGSRRAHPTSSGSETECRLRAVLDAAADKPDTILDMYKFYQERVESLRSRIWTMLVWLSGAQAAILIFIIKELHTTFAGSPTEIFRMEQPLLAFVLSVFGIALATYMMHVIDDGSGHIEANWRRADIVLGKTPPHEVEQNVRRRRGNHPVCRVMAEVAGWARIIQIALALLAIVALVDKWGLYDVPYVGTDSGRVARPFGSTLTDPGRRLSRTRLFPEVTRIGPLLASRGE